MKISIAQFAVMGNPVSHSKSPEIHVSFAKQFNLALQYEALLVPPQGFRDSLCAFQKQGGKGLNVTLPFKQQAFMLMDKLGKAAQRAGAVNTILFYSDGTRYGENTDGIGFLNDYCKNHGGKIENQSILILGAGGAARGILGPLLEQQPSRVTLVNRLLSKAQVLSQDFSRDLTIETYDYDTLPISRYDLIINTTSASLTQDIPNLSPELFSSNPICYDMVYQKQLTSFLLFAKAHGASECIDGLGMLVEQAAESFFLWHGMKPDTESVIKKIRKHL